MARIRRVLMRRWREQDDTIEVMPVRRVIQRCSSRRQATPALNLLSEADAGLPSQHALLRMAQRRLTACQVAYVVTYGGCVRRAGGAFYVLRRCDIPPADLGSDWVAKLEGAVVLMDGDAIITVY